MFFFFLFSMGLLFLSRRYLLFITFWDLLGFSSVLLVFFYGRWDSWRGSLNTSLTSRFGDFMLLLFGIFLITIGGSSWLIFSFMIYIVFLSSFTKSPQTPIAGWLLLAISAPTPISALVHSSTLVVAGILLFFMFLDFENLIFLFLPLLSFFVSGFLSIFEGDLKKIIALSTLSQISLCVLLFLGGLLFICYFHMCVHAVIKSYLFLQVGTLIFFSFGMQLVYRFFSFLSVSILPIFFCCFGLLGLFFTSGGLTKDFLLNFINRGSLFYLLVIFYMRFLLTCIYSYRVLILLFLKDSRVFINLFGFLFYIFFRLFILFFGYFFLFNFLYVYNVFSFHFVSLIPLFIIFGSLFLFNINFNLLYPLNFSPFYRFFRSRRFLFLEDFWISFLNIIFFVFKFFMNYFILVFVFIFWFWFCFLFI